VVRVQLIRCALSIGFSVSDLADIFRERDGGGIPCRRVRELAAEKLVTLEARLRDLRSWRRELRNTLAEWDRLLAMTARGKQDRLLEALAATHPKSHTPRSFPGVLARGNQKEVEAKDPGDAATRNGIRTHLTHITQAFQDGDFDIPMFVHGTVPPGVTEMKKLRRNIHYSLEEIPDGGRVVISSSDKEALAAIHKFLRFQIEEHKTGDPMKVR